MVEVVAIIVQEAAYSIDYRPLRLRLLKRIEVVDLLLPSQQQLQHRRVAAHLPSVKFDENVENVVH